MDAVSRFLASASLVAHLTKPSWTKFAGTLTCLFLIVKMHNRSSCIDWIKPVPCIVTVLKWSILNTFWGSTLAMTGTGTSSKLRLSADSIRYGLIGCLSKMASCDTRKERVRLSVGWPSAIVGSSHYTSVMLWLTANTPTASLSYSLPVIKLSDDEDEPLVKIHCRSIFSSFIANAKISWLFLAVTMKEPSSICEVIETLLIDAFTKYGLFTKMSLFDCLA